MPVTAREALRQLIVSFPLDDRSGLHGGAGPGSLQHELPLAAQAVVAGRAA